MNLLAAMNRRKDITDMLNTVYCVDALTLLGALPDASVDLFLSDFPYATTACEWDSLIPLEPMWCEIKRILKPSGAAVLTASQPFTTVLAMSNLAWLRYEWIWEKTRATGYLNANRVPMKAHENVLVFYEQGGAYNPQMEKGEAYAATRGSVGGHIRDKTVGGYLTVNVGERYPRSVLKFASEGETVHPTQKPVDLFRYLIRTYTNEGDLVVDSCVGSGTTAVSARAEKRNYIVGDSSQHYVNVTLDRLRMPLEPLKVQPEVDYSKLPLFAGVAGE